MISMDFLFLFAHIDLLYECFQHFHLGLLYCQTLVKPLAFTEQFQPKLGIICEELHHSSLLNVHKPKMAFSISYHVAERADFAVYTSVVLYSAVVRFFVYSKLCLSFD